MTRSHRRSGFPLRLVATICVTRFRAGHVAAVLLLVLGLGGVGLAGTAAGGDVPATARSEALGAPPVLLGGPAVAFLFPQASVLEPPQLVGFAGSSVTTCSFGAFFASGSQRFLAAARPADRPGAFSAGDLLYPYDYDSSPEIQAGWSAGGRRLRFGLAGRGYVRREDDSRIYEYLDQTPTSEVAGTGEREQVIEAAAGIGVGGRRWLVDGLCELRWRSAKRTSGYLNERPPDSPEALYIVFEEDESPLPGVRLRAEYLLGRETSVVAAAGWMGGDQAWTGLAYGVLQGVSVDTLARIRRYEQTWTAGLAVSGPACGFHNVVAAAQYEAGRIPDYEAPSSGYLAQVERVRRTGRVSLGVEETIWRDLVLRTGLEAQYSYTRAQYLEVTARYSSVTIRQTETKHEDLSDRFTLGAGYPWRRLRLDAAANVNLRLLEPFYAVDFRFAL